MSTLRRYRDGIISETILVVLILVDYVCNLFGIQDLHICLIEQYVLLKFLDYGNSIIFTIINQIGQGFLNFHIFGFFSRIK